MSTPFTLPDYLWFPSDETKYYRINLSANETISVRTFAPHHADYLKLYKHSFEQLKKYREVAVNSYSFYSEEKKRCITIKGSRSEPIFAYVQEHFVKIYSPLAKDKKFRFVHLGKGKKPKDFIFGYEQLPARGPVLIITGGEKDVITVDAMGIPAITLNSEGANLTAELHKELASRFKDILVLYDNDTTGITASKKLASHFNLGRILLPDMKGGKDVSDFIKLGNPKYEFQILVETAIRNKHNFLHEDNLEKITAQPEKINETEEAPAQASYKPSNEEQYRVMECVNEIVARKLDLTALLSDWIKIGYSLASLGESGRELFHKVSQFYPKYKREECDEKFAYLIKSYNGAIKIGTFFWYCAQAGIAPKPVESQKNEAAKTTIDGLEPTPFDKETPFIGDLFFEKAPAFFKDIIKLSDRRREKDILVIGAITSFGNALPGVKIIYDGRKYGINTNLFITAKAASGKGRLETVKELFKVIDNLYEQRYKKEMGLYKENKAAYDATKDEDNDIFNEEPIEPVRKKFFLTADSSNSAFVNRVKNSDGRGVLLDTEGKTLSNSFGQEWGDFSTILLKAFQNESIEISRNSGDIEIDFPEFSVALSGTPSQLLAVFPGTEDGLFSRFLFYVFFSEPVWDERVFDPQYCGQRENISENLSSRIGSMYKMIEGMGKNLVFEWKQPYIDKLNTHFKAWLKQYYTVFGGDSASVIFRLGVISSRIAAILSLVRKLDNATAPGIQTSPNTSEYRYSCTDDDFECTVHLIELYLDHTFRCFEYLHSKEAFEPKILVKGVQVKFYQALPSTFKRSEAIKVAEGLKISERAAGGYLGDFVNKEMLERLDGKGNYQKIEKQ
jgi:hypothetical protein